MPKELISDHEEIVRALRTAIDDTDKKYGNIGTSDFLTGPMQKHEKMACKLRKYFRD